MISLGLLVGCRGGGTSKQISYPKKNTWNPEEVFLSLGKNGGKSMLSAGNRQKVEEEDQTKDEKIQCRDCHPEANPITNSE
jgi:hypothetical protein